MRPDSKRNNSIVVRLQPAGLESSLGPLLLCAFCQAISLSVSQCLFYKMLPPYPCAGGVREVSATIRGQMMGRKLGEASSSTHLE